MKIIIIILYMHISCLRIRKNWKDILENNPDHFACKLKTQHFDTSLTNIFLPIAIELLESWDQFLYRNFYQNKMLIKITMYLFVRMIFSYCCWTIKCVKWLYEQFVTSIKYTYLVKASHPDFRLKITWYKW